MVVAYLAADRAALFGVLSNLEAFQKADPFMFLLVSVLVLAFGAGAVSLDRLMQRPARLIQFRRDSRMERG